MNRMTKGQIEAALLFTSSDRVRPQLRAVKCEPATLRATDSYRAITVNTETGDTGALIDRDYLAQAAKFATKREPAIVLDKTESEVAIVAQANGLRMPVPEVEGSYPEFDRITPDPKDYVATITVDPAFLEDICKAAKKLDSPIVTLHITAGDFKPLVFEIGQSAHGLLMPVRR